MLVSLFWKKHIFMSMTLWFYQGKFDLIAKIIFTKPSEMNNLCSCNIDLSPASINNAMSRDLWVELILKSRAGASTSIPQPFANVDQISRLCKINKLTNWCPGQRGERRARQNRATGTTESEVLFRLFALFVPLFHATCPFNCLTSAGQQIIAKIGDTFVYFDKIPKIRN